MRSLIIGGAGFVGEYLAAHLLSIGDEVTSTYLPGESIAMSGVKPRALNILDEQALAQTLFEEAPEHIYHLAAQSSVGLSWKRPALTIDVNVKGTCNLLQALATQKSAARLLLVGSSEEYGYIREQDCPVREDAPLRPGNVYAATKAAQNMLGGVYARAYKLDVLMSRAFNHIGPKQKTGFVTADFCRQIALIEAGKLSCIRVGNLEAKRDFTDVRDVVRAYALLARQGAAGESYNIGRGEAVSIGSILDMLLSMARCEIKIETDPDKLRPSDVPLIAADTAKLQAATSWRPQIPLEDTLKACLDYWREAVKAEE